MSKIKLRLKPKVKPDPVFINATIAYVPSDDELSSDDSDIDAAQVKVYGLEKIDLKDLRAKVNAVKAEIAKSPPSKEKVTKAKRELPYFVDVDKRGTISKAELVEYEDSPSKVKQEIIDRIDEESFADDEAEPTRKDNFRASIMLNRPRSLRSSRNKALEIEASSKVESDLSVYSDAVYWDMPWDRKYNNTAEARSRPKPPHYEEMRCFYKLVKAKDPMLAKDFVRVNEKNYLNSMVPYRELREANKNSAKTKEAVTQARLEAKGAPIYMSFVDSDTLSFKYNGVGIYTAYTKLIRSCAGVIDVATTGFLYEKEGLEILQLGSKLDMAVRVGTAKYLPNGVYYPEQSFAVLVPEGKDTVPESFIGSDRKNYVTPQESVILLENIAKVRTPNTQPNFRFVNNPILTATPARALENKRHTALVFKAKKKGDKFVDWVEQDIINITSNLAQSHAKGLEWAKHVLNGFEYCAKPTGVKMRMDHVANSLLSRLFNHYDPTVMVEDVTVGTYRTKLCVVLKDYDTYLDRPLAKGGLDVKKGSAADKAFRTELNNINTVAGLLERITKVVKIDDVFPFHEAAKAAGRGMRDVLDKELQKFIMKP